MSIRLSFLAHLAGKRALFQGFCMAADSHKQERQISDYQKRIDLLLQAQPQGYGFNDLKTAFAQGRTINRTKACRLDASHSAMGSSACMELMQNQNYTTPHYFTALPESQASSSMVERSHKAEPHLDEVSLKSMNFELSVSSISASPLPDSINKDPIIPMSNKSSSKLECNDKLAEADEAFGMASKKSATLKRQYTATVNEEWNDDMEQAAAAFGLSKDVVLQARAKAKADSVVRSQGFKGSKVVASACEQGSASHHRGQTSKPVKVEFNYALSELSDDKRQRHFASLDIMRSLGFIVTPQVYKEYCCQMENQGLEPLSKYNLVALLVASFFAKDGVLSQTLDHYSPRYGQIEFADAVVRALANKSVLVVEAGTGTGKTFSYLVPPIMAGNKIMVSTKTKALQDQLISKDIPKLCEMMNLSHLSYIGLKGMSNYFCRYKFDGTNLVSQASSYNNKLFEAFERCKDEIDLDIEHASFGEINIKLPDSIRAAISCDTSACYEMSDSCPYAKVKAEFLSQCNKSIQEVLTSHAKLDRIEIMRHAYAYKLPHINGDHCFSFAARHEAKSRDICVINHSLLLASLAQKSTLGDLGAALPKPDILVIDEAHTLAEVARDFYKRELSVKIIKKLEEKVHQCFYDNKEVSTNTGDFSFNLGKITCIADILDSICMLMDEGRYSFSDFKYMHHKKPSPLQLLGHKMANSSIKAALGKDSYFMKEVVKGLKLSGDKLWSAEDELEFAQKQHAQGSLLDGVNVIEDDDNDEILKSNLAPKVMPISRVEAKGMKRKLHREKKLFDIYLQDLYRKTLTKYYQDKQITEADLKSLDYQSSVNEFSDVILDETGHLQVEPYFHALMADFYHALRELKSLLSNNKELSSKQTLVDIVSGYITEHLDCIKNFMSSDRNKQQQEHFNYAAWVDISHEYGYLLSVCPIDISQKIREMINTLQEQGICVLFTSATITVEQNFNKFCADIGFSPEELTSKIVDSPFDYQKNACLLISEHFPDISERYRMRTALNMLDELITSSPGGIFVLTTSLEQMNMAKLEIENRYSSRRKVLMQGDDTNLRILEQFKEDGRAILIGTASFWEGVDVPGNALTLVIIDKLPFKSLGDPIQQARKNKVERVLNLNHFGTVVLPEAIIALRQGAGRLIRNEKDKGVLVILDPRMITKGYGRQVLTSLPPMSIVSTVDEALKFFEK